MFIFIFVLPSSSVRELLGFPVQPLAPAQGSLQVYEPGWGSFLLPRLPLWLYFFSPSNFQPHITTQPRLLLLLLLFIYFFIFKACTSKHAAGNTGGVDLTPQTSS